MPPRRQGTLLTRSDPIRLFLPAATHPVAPTAPTDVPLAEGHRDFSAGQKGSLRGTPSALSARRIKIGVMNPLRSHAAPRAQPRGPPQSLASARDDADGSTSKSSRPREPKVEFKQRQLLMLKAIGTRLMPSASVCPVRLDDKIHDRRIETNHGWRVDLGKGLDIWQRPSDNPSTSVAIDRSFASLVQRSPSTT